jgi:hypothetical protein
MKTVPANPKLTSGISFTVKPSLACHMDESFCAECGWTGAYHSNGWRDCPDGTVNGFRQSNHIWQSSPDERWNGAVKVMNPFATGGPSTSAPKKLENKFPHSCPGCGRPAYIGLNTVECSMRCRPDFARK